MNFREDAEIDNGTCRYKDDMTPSVPGEKSCPFFNGFARKGDRNDEVKKIQNFLNEKESGGLVVDGVFGDLTDKAVHRFQNKYFDEIIAPWQQLDHSTGWWYKTTSAWANTLMGCPTTAQI